MEILGAIASGVALAVLFKCAIEALKFIHLYETQDIDFDFLQLQFKLEKGRLYNWGDVMGLTDDSKKNRLSEWHLKNLACEALRHIIDMFSHTHVIRKQYGCDNTWTLPAPLDTNGITNAFHRFKAQPPKFNSERVSPLTRQNGSGHTEPMEVS